MAVWLALRTAALGAVPFARGAFLRSGLAEETSAEVNPWCLNYTEAAGDGPEFLEYPQALHAATMPGTGPPLMYMTDSGCSGSSAFGETLDVLLLQSGVERYNVHCNEILSPQKNAFYKSSTSMAEALMKMNQAANEAGKRLVFKGSLSGLTDEVGKALVAMGTKAIVFNRRNVLDHLVRRVRDCFDTVNGYPVDEAGHRNDLCFERRDSDVTTKAFLYPEKLIGALQAEVESMDEASQRLADVGFGLVEAFAMEDIFEYEAAGADGAVERSFKEWSKVLAAFDVKLKKQALSSMLTEGAGTWPQTRHSDVIHNIEAVREVLLGGDAQMRGLLRD